VKKRVAAARAVAGTVAGGLVALACAVTGVQLAGGAWGLAGPGWASTAWHVSAAAAAIGALRFARGTWAAALCLAIAAVLLWLRWWS
jgi:hypothetical protein